MGPNDDRIEEYDDGFDSRDSFERYESDTEETLRNTDDEEVNWDDDER